MRIIMLGKVPSTEWWVNCIEKCSHCGTETQLERDDAEKGNVELLTESPSGDKGVFGFTRYEVKAITFACPHCKSKMVIHPF